MLEMVQTKSAASSVTDHRGNIAVAGGGESASVISQHNNLRWRLFQVSIGERMEKAREGGEVAEGGNATQQCAIACHSPGYPHTGNNRWFYFYLCDFLFPSGQSIWLMLSINILLKCDKANESFNCCGTGRESLAYIYTQAKCDKCLVCSCFIHPVRGRFSREPIKRWVCLFT